MNNFMKKATGQESDYVYNESDMPVKSCIIDESIIQEVFEDPPIGEDTKENVDKIMRKQVMMNSTRSLQSSVVQDEEYDSDAQFEDDPEMEFKMRGKDLDYITVIKKDKLEKIATMKD